MIGCHVNREEKISLIDTIQNAIYDCNVYSLKMSIISIFVSNPRRLQIIISDEEIIDLKDFINKKNIILIAHSSYAAFLWGGINLQSRKVTKFVEREYTICKEAGIKGLVVHLPKQEIIKKEKSIIRDLINFTDEKNRENEEIIPIIYLETPAITPMFANYDNGIKLSKLFSIIEKESKLLNKPHPFGLCIDTAHIWTSGNDISTYLGAKRWFSELMDMPYIQHDRIIIHLNDSERDLGHGPDKHASLTEGKIWNFYKTRAKLRDSGICFILEFAQSNNIPIILERRDKEMLKNDYQILQKLI